MNSALRVVIYWVLIAPLLFTVIAQVIVLPSSLLARLFYEPANQPTWLRIVLVAVSIAAFVTSGAFVWWGWRRFHVPVLLGGTRLRRVLTAIAILAALPFIIGYSGLYGLFAGPEDFNAHYAANDLMCVLEIEVQLEIDHKVPQGSTEPFSSGFWVRHWAWRANQFAS